LNRILAKLSREVTPLRVVSFVLVFLFLTALNAAYGSINQLSPDRITVVAQALVQFDSFLTAGWSIGFFYFWGVLTKAHARGLEMLYSFQDVLAPRNDSRSNRPRIEKDGSIHGSPIDPREISRYNYFYGVGPLVFFTLSAVYAIDSLFSVSADDAFFSLVLSVTGILIMLRSWYVFQEMAIMARDAEPLISQAVEARREAETVDKG
jgi:hypothetical protein